MPQGPFNIIIDDSGQQRLVPAMVGGGGFSNQKGPPGPAVTPLGIQIITGVAGGQVQQVKGRNLLVILRLSADGDIILPPLGQADMGTRITFVRDLGVGVPTVVVSAGTDQVNETASAEFTPYILRSLQDSVTYLRVPSGWQREQGTPAGVLISSASATVNVPFGVEGTQYVILTDTDQTVQLPIAFPECREGYRVVVLNQGTGPASVVANNFDQINNLQPLEGLALPVGSTIILELSRSASNNGKWIAVALNTDPAPLISASSTVDVPAWHGFGRQVVRVSDPAATVNLPPVADLAIGASILVEVAGGGGSLVTIVPDAADSINGLNVRQVTANRAALLVSDGTQWVATDGAWFSLPPQVSASNPLSVIQWIDSPKFVTSAAAGAGHLINLPSAALLSYGAWAVIFNNSADAASIAADGSDTINGAAAVALAAGDSAAVYRVTAGSWFAVGV